MPRRHQQGTEQGELPRTQLDGLVAQGDLSQQQMHLQRTQGHLFMQAGAAAEQLAAAGHQFLEAERFAQHILGATVEQGHHGLGAGAGREHQGRAAQLGCKLQGRGLLQQFSPHKQIGLLLLAELKGFRGGAGGRREMALLPQPLGQHKPQGGVGLHHKDAGAVLFGDLDQPIDGGPHYPKGVSCPSW